jgi:hypothetical protein
VKRWFGPLVILSALAAAPPAASAATFSFSCFSLNSPTDCNILESQISVDITQTADWINFKFLNSGPEASFIDGLYFADPPPSLLGGAPKFVYSDAGIKFSAGCSPGDLPNKWGTTYCSDADAPAPKNGANPDEWVQVSYLLKNPATQSLATVVNYINAGTFDIGIKVQGFASGGSEWGVVAPPRTTVPEPGTLALLGIGVAAMVVRRRGGDA